MNKIKNAAVATLLGALGLLTIPAFATPSQTIDDLSLIDLRKDASIQEFRFNYPGIDGPNGFDYPDCLVITTGPRDPSQPVPGDALETLVAGILVHDGDAVLFPHPDRTLNLLEAEQAGSGRHHGTVYRIKDLSKFVTGIRVSTRGDQTFAELVRDAFGESYDGLVALQLVRGCRQF